MATDRGRTITLMDLQKLVARGQRPDMIEMSRVLIEQAIRQNASDMHFEIREGAHTVRFRVDGILHDVLVMPNIYDKQQGFAAESIRHFVDCVLHDRQPMVTGRDGLEVTKVICAVEESVRTRRPVDLD